MIGWINYRNFLKMGTIVVKSAVKRKLGYIYYIDQQGNICEAKLIKKRGNGRRKTNKEIKNTREGMHIKDIKRLEYLKSIIDKEKIGQDEKLYYSKQRKEYDEWTRRKERGYIFRLRSEYKFESGNSKVKKKIIEDNLKRIQEGKPLTLSLAVLNGQLKEKWLKKEKLSSNGLS